MLSHISIMSSWKRYLFAPLFVAAVMGLVGVSLFADLRTGNSMTELALIVVDTRVLLALAVGIFAIAFILYLVALRGEDRDRLVSGGKSVDALIPVYEEADVMHRSVEHLAENEYEDLKITIVCEPDDNTSRERAQELANEYDRVRVLVNNQRQGSKAGALNTGIKNSDAQVIGMFDSDQEPHEKLVPHAMAYLDDHDVARVRSLPDPSGGVIESMAYYEYLLLFFLPQKLVRFLLGMQFVGTRSVLVDREVFNKVGLFSEDHLTEDMDFTHRCHQAGLAIRALLYYPCLEQPAHTIRDWWGQRVRWMTGHFEIGGSYLRNPRRMLDPDYLGSVLTLVGTFVAGVVMSVTLPKLVVAAIGSPLIIGTGLLGFYGFPVATRLVDNRTTQLDGLGVAWLLLPLTFTMFGLVIIQVVIKRAFGLEPGWYSVEKQA